jgi:hypothetical protein
VSDLISIRLILCEKEGLERYLILIIFFEVIQDEEISCFSNGFEQKELAIL